MAARRVLSKCMQQCALSVIFCQFYVCISVMVVAGLTLPKGVPPSLSEKYATSQTFQCLNGEGTISFGSINDNYCDCADGSDEPGTSACPVGQFYCGNIGYKPLQFPSSRVNDGICDCCDGTDEYDGKVSCQNTCNEVGAKYREELRKLQEEAEKGYSVKLQNSKEGLEAKAKRQARLASLRNSIEQSKQNLAQFEERKNAAEAIEKEEVGKFDANWAEIKKQKLEEIDKKRSKDAFDRLDANKDGSITKDEITNTLEFDKDSDNDVSEEEAMDVLGDAGVIADYETFAFNVWPRVKDMLNKPKLQAQDPETETAKEDERRNLDNEIIEDDDEEEETESQDRATISEEQEIDATKPDYDDNLKSIVADADKAREEFKTAEEEKKKIEEEINEIDKILNIDFGSSEEFSYLYGQCFKFNDREYTYELCPFNKVTQTPLAGGSQTSLGNWGSWIGTENKYSKMKYDGGLNCWNGPDRSASIVLLCGIDNELISASEPNRCEYLMELKTPAACDLNTAEKTAHDEL